MATVGHMPSANAAGGVPRPPLLYDLSERQSRLLDSVVAFVVWVVVELALRSTHGAPRSVGIAFGLLACAPVAFRRRWPLEALAAGTLCVAVETALGRPLLALSVVLSLLVYMVAARVSRAWSIRALVATEVTLILALWVGIGTHNFHGSIGSGAVESFLPIVAAWFVGDSVTARRAYVAGLVEQAEQQRITEIERGRQAVREERIRIARELHDVVAHSLTVITVQAGVGRRLLARQPEQARDALESIEATGRTAQDELRVVLGLLRDDDTERAALEPAPGLADLTSLVETVRAAGTPVELHISGLDRRLSPALQLSVYRIIQEALTNVVKHVPGAHATVDLAVTAGDVSIEVADDGLSPARTPSRTTGAEGAESGAESQETPSQGSQHGIVGMHERVGAFGGSLVAEARPGSGFHVVATIPLRDSA
jgi:signal transduction histidine kinase